MENVALGSIFEKIILDLDCLKQIVNQHRAKQISSPKTRQATKKIVQDYFRGLRPSLNGKFDIEELDKIMQNLLEISNVRALKTAYLSRLKFAKKAFIDLETKWYYQLSNNTIPNLIKTVPQDIEVKIINTLNIISPSVVVSYRQTIIDLSDENRLSYRGTTAELREVLREVLDYLAPNNDVQGEKGFKLEINQSKPTMRQKVRFILKARGFNSGAAKLTEDYVSVIDNSVENIASIARSTYARGSDYSHTEKGNQRSDCLQYKMYIDTILCELLEIHTK